MDQPTSKLHTEQLHADKPHPSQRPAMPDYPMSLNAIEFDGDPEFMLKIMQMIQKEQDIRARTRALEQLRRTANEVE